MGKKKSIKVLVVGDDSLFADFVANKKSFLNYESIKVANGEQALRVASSQSPFDFLLTNIMPPEMNGMDFTEKFTKLYPKTSVLYKII